MAVKSTPNQKSSGACWLYYLHSVNNKQCSMDLEKLDSSLSGIKVSVGIHRKHQIPPFSRTVRWILNQKKTERGTAWISADHFVSWFFATRSFSTMNNCPFMKWFVKGGRQVGSVFSLDLISIISRLMVWGPRVRETQWSVWIKIPVYLWFLQ